MRRPLGSWLVLLLLLLLLAGACAPAAALVRGPVLEREGVVTLLVAADQARAEAFARADPGPLRAVFADSAIAVLVPQLRRLRQRSQRVEERSATRRLGHWAAAEGSGEGVLEMAGEQRISQVAGPPSPWTRIVRQWRAALGWSGGRWRVLRSEDLPPDQWWQQ